jgi:hypothetical protein
VATTALIDNIVGDDDTADTSIADEDVNDDVCNNHVLRCIPDAEIVDEADGDLSNVVATNYSDEDDDMCKLNVVVMNEIADHVLVCGTGTAGLSPDRWDDRSSDAAADEAEADKTSVSDLLVYELDNTLR